MASFSLCVSGHAKAEAAQTRDILGIGHGALECSGALWQVPARRSKRRVGAL